MDHFFRIFLGLDLLRKLAPIVCAVFHFHLRNMLNYFLYVVCRNLLIVRFAVFH